LIALIAVAVNILWSGGRLAWRSAVGLLDYSDPETDQQIREKPTQSATNWECIIMACAAAPRDTGISLQCTCCSLKRRRLGRRIDWRLRSKNVCRWN
jgi:hypothetical protein